MVLLTFLLIGLIGCKTKIYEPALDIIDGATVSIDGFDRLALYRESDNARNKLMGVKDSGSMTAIEFKNGKKIVSQDNFKFNLTDIYVFTDYIYLIFSYDGTGGRTYIIERETSKVYHLKNVYGLNIETFTCANGF